MSASKELFEKYLSRLFLETGTYKGEGVEMALDAGYQYVFSVELSRDLHKEVMAKYSEDDRVLVVCGDSATWLSYILDFVEEPVTFWLDAHWSGGETARGAEVSPLMRELDVIKNHPIKTHTIMMDDIRDWESMYGFNIDDVKKKILSINHDYIFTLEDGFAPKDILVAWIEY